MCISQQTNDFSSANAGSTVQIFTKNVTLQWTTHVHIFLYFLYYYFSNICVPMSVKCGQ